MRAPLAEGRGLPNGVAFLFALIGGFAVANLYWAQPLLTEIGATFGIGAATAGFAITVTQVAYAAGVFLVVPLGDVVDRRSLLAALAAACAVSLAAAALAPTFAALLVALAFVGMTTLAGPLLASLAADLAAPDRRGRALSAVASGLIFGVLGARASSGILADALGWRGVYGIAAVLAVLAAVALWMTVPALERRQRIRYGALLRSVAGIVVSFPAARLPLLTTGVVFGAITLYWTALTLLLTSDPIGAPPSVVGLFGLLGAAGALAAQPAGWIFDRGWMRAGIVVALAVGAASLGVSWFAPRSLAALVVGILLLEMAARTVTVLCSAAVQSVRSGMRSRLSSAFVVSTFTGGALGSAAATWLWASGGWSAVILGAGLCFATMLPVWVVRLARGR